MELPGRSHNRQGHEMDNSLPPPGTTLLQHKTKADVTAVQLCHHTENDICGRHMVHPHLQAQRSKEKQQLCQSHTQASVHPEDGLHCNHRDSTHNIHRHSGTTCRPPPNRPPISQGMPPSGSMNSFTPRHAPSSHPLPTAGKKIYQDTLSPATQISTHI
jgi:hypothetical protein